MSTATLRSLWFLRSRCSSADSAAHRETETEQRRIILLLGVEEECFVSIPLDGLIIALINCSLRFDTFPSPLSFFLNE